MNKYRDNYDGIFAKTPDAKKQITLKKKEEIPLEYQKIQEYLNAEGIDRPVMEVVREANSWFAKEVELLNEAQMAIYNECILSSNTYEEAIAAVRK